MRYNYTKSDARKALIQEHISNLDGHDISSSTQRASLRNSPFKLIEKWSWKLKVDSVEDA
jgi:hypothetical protein